MSDLTDSPATGPVLGGAAVWMLTQLWGRFTRQGETAEVKLAERVEGGLGDHKAKLDNLVPRVVGTEVRVDALEKERDWLRDQLVKLVAKVGELEGRAAVGR
jgi:hypothetical protein